MGIKIEEGKTYRNKKGHLIFVKQQISDSQFLCVREVRGFCQLEVFDLTGKPSQTARVAMDFFISEEVPTGETVSDKDPKPFSHLSNPNTRTEVSRFVSYSDNEPVRITVFKDSNGYYHINREHKIDHLRCDRKDIHGAMDKDAYIAWLSSALFNHSFLSANEDDKRWMMENS